MKLAFAPFVVAALLLTGCSGPTKDAEYKNINDLASAYETGLGDGMKCSRTENDIDDYNWLQTTCGQHTILMMFTSDAMRTEIKGKNPLDAGDRWVQGANWLIEAPQFEAERAQKALGGELLR